MMIMLVMMMMKGDAREDDTRVRGEGMEGSRREMEEAELVLGV